MFRCLLPLLLLVTPAPAPSLPAAFVPPPILMYHRVDADRPAGAVGRDLTLSPERFREQLAYLRENGIAAISMAQLEQRLEQGLPLDHTVVLTFDDGYEDQARFAVPLLREFGDSATFYIITGEVGRPHHLTWAQIAAMQSEDMDIAAHGVWHDDLSEMSSAQQIYEVNESIATLQRRLHRRVESYAYPSGRFNRETLAVVRAAGIPLAVTTDLRYVLPPENRLEMTRVRVRSEWALPQFTLALRSALAGARIVRR